MLEMAELTPSELRLCVKAAEGRLLDLRCGRATDDAPASDGRWGSERQVRAQVLVQLLTGQGPPLATTVGAVRLRGAAIVGRLNLGGETLRCPLELYESYLGGRLDLAKAAAPNISLRGSCLRRRLSARQLTVTHSLGGVPDCAGARLANPGGQALLADGLAVDGGCSCPTPR